MLLFDIPQKYWIAAPILFIFKWSAGIVESFRLWNFLLNVTHSFAEVMGKSSNVPTKPKNIQFVDKYDRDKQEILLLIY